MYLLFLQTLTQKGFFLKIHGKGVLHAEAPTPQQAVETLLALADAATEVGWWTVGITGPRLTGNRTTKKNGSKVDTTKNVTCWKESFRWTFEELMVFVWFHLEIRCLDHVYFLVCWSAGTWESAEYMRSSASQKGNVRWEWSRVRKKCQVSRSSSGSG